MPPAVAAPTPFAPGSGPRRTPRPAPNAAGQPVFNPPVPTPDLQQPGSIRPLRRQAGAGIGPFYRLFALVPPGPFHATDLCQAGPVQVVVQGRRGPQTPPLPPVSVPALLARGPPARMGKALPPRWLLKEQAHRLLHRGLVVQRAGCPSAPRNSPRPARAPSDSTPAARTARPR